MRERQTKGIVDGIRLANQIEREEAKLAKLLEKVEDQEAIVEALKAKASKGAGGK
jgi:hypothetical protein